jgi:hypothetical protein
MKTYRNGDVVVRLSSRGLSLVARENALLRAADRRRQQEQDAIAWLLSAIGVVIGVIAGVNLIVG